MVNSFQSSKKWSFFSFESGKPSGTRLSEQVKVMPNYFEVIKPRINIFPLAHLIQSGTK